jgi:hypothetical protein
VSRSRRYGRNSSCILHDPKRSPITEDTHPVKPNALPAIDVGVQWKKRKKGKKEQKRKAPIDRSHTPRYTVGDIDLLKEILAGRKTKLIVRSIRSISQYLLLRT